MGKAYEKRIGYNIIYAYVKLGFYLFYRRYIIIGKRNVNIDTSIILAANHQNGLMDPLAMTFALNRPVVFLTRADLFKNPKVNKILSYLRLFPVYRKRDGVETMDRNEQIFEDCVDVLNHNLIVGLFPEASHKGVRQLRQLKTGIARIAYRDGLNRSTCILPMGLEYSNYFEGYTDLIVNIGEPIPVSDYDNKADYIKLFMDRLDSDMRSLIIDVPKLNYETINKSIYIYQNYLKQVAKKDIVYSFKQARELANQFKSWTKDDIFMGKIEANINRIDALSSTPFNELEVFVQPPTVKLLYKGVALLVTLPIFLMGFIINFIPYRISIHFASKIKDMHLMSSFLFALYITLFPIFYILLSAILFGLICNPLIWVAVPILGVFALYYKKIAEQFFKEFSLFKKLQFNDKKTMDVRNRMIDVVKLIQNKKSESI